MIDCGETLTRREAPEWRRQVVSYLILPAAALALGAMIALSASAETTVATPRDDPLQCCGETDRNIAQVACGDRAAGPRHPAKGANIPLGFHLGQDQTFAATHRNAS
jgi:hypothetical protein